MVKKNSKSGKEKNKKINGKKKVSNKKNVPSQPQTEVGFQLIFHKSKESKESSYLEPNSKNSSGNQEQNICLNILYMMKI